MTKLKSLLQIPNAAKWIWSFGLKNYGTYMLSEGKVGLKEGSDSSYVFPIIIEQISLQGTKILLNSE